MREIDYNKIFANLDTFTGLPLILRGRKWNGRCYIDGSDANRRDKTVAYIKNDRITILEQGGDVLSIWEWLVKYGGCRDYKEAYKKLIGDDGVRLERQAKRYVEPPLKYVYEQVVQNTLCEYSDNLFLALSKHFNKERIVEVYKRYTVGNMATKMGILTIFWYIDSEGRICYDKKMLYREDGHRDKNYGGGRKFKVDMGFRAKCYFGEHLIKEDSRVFVVESEKTAIIMSLFDKRKDIVYIATGGVNQLREVKEGWKLLRDYDKAGEIWESRGECVKWWERYDGVQEGWDIGDVALAKMENIKNIKKSLEV